MKPFLNFSRGQDGTALIETALIVPIFTLLLIGAADFTLLVSQYLRVADSARTEAVGATLRTYATNISTLNLVGYFSAQGVPGYQVNAINYCTCANGTAVVSCSSHLNCGQYGIPNQYIKVTATASLPMLFGIQGFPSKLTSPLLP